MESTQILSRGREWSADDCELLRRLAKTGEPVARIALALRRSEWAVYARMRQDRIARTRSGWSPDEIRALVDMCGLVSQRRAAETLCRPRTQVQRMIDELGLYWSPGVRAPVRFDEEVDKVITRGLLRADSWRRIAAAVGRKPLAVRRRAARLGLVAAREERAAGVRFADPRLNCAPAVEACAVGGDVC